MPQCAAVLDLLSGFAAADVADGDALRLLGMAAHAIGDTVRSVDFLSRAEDPCCASRAGSGLLSQVLSMQVIDWLELGDWNLVGRRGRRGGAARQGDRPAHLAGGHAGL